MNHAELISFTSQEDLVRAAAAAWLDEIEASQRAGRLHCVALSGGRIAQDFFAATAVQAAARKVSFSNVHFFWADERCVPPADPASNYKLAAELLFAPLHIAAENIHRLRGEELPAAAAAITEQEFRHIAAPGGERQPILDLIVLGMGEDGHVASLFPHAMTRDLAVTAPFFVVTDSPKPPPVRLSLSYQAIFAASQVWVLISGASKAAALRASLSEKPVTPLGQVVAARPVKIFNF